MRSSECGWKQCEIKLLGRTLTGITAWELKKTVEKEHLYGAGGQPIDIVEGNSSYEGSVTLLGFEYDMMNTAAIAAGYNDITEVPHEATVMTVSYKRTLADRTTVVTARGIAFTEIPHGIGSGDKNRSYELPFICMDVKSITL